MTDRSLIRSSEPTFKLLYRLIDIVFIALTLYVSVANYTSSFNNNYQIAGALGIVVFLLAAESCHLYRSWRVNTFRDFVMPTLLAWVLTASMLMMIGYFTKTSSDFSRVAMGIWLSVTPCVLLTWRFMLKQFIYHLYRNGYYTQKAAIIGVTENGIALAEELTLKNSPGIVLEGFYDERTEDRIPDKLNAKLCGTVIDALEKARRGDLQHIYIAMPLYAKGRITTFLSQFSDTTANIYILPDFFIYDPIYTRWSHIGKIQTLSVFDTPFNGLSALVKRTEDIILSTIILALISPLFVAIAIGVKLSSPGPVFFKQDRYGLDGKKFKLWKFRSMYTMDNGLVIKQATKNDPRITPFGAFIRRTSLDELPQFINVLQGTMSIVGPRPHAVAHNEEYRAIIKRYMLRHKVKPGITGWAQINGYRGETDTLMKMEKRVEYDLAYIQRWSLLMDLKIIYLTILHGFTGSMAY